jgi:hypothetical protein
MNDIDGDTEKQQAVIRVMKKNPGALHADIAVEAGVTQQYASYVLSKRERIKEAPPVPARVRTQNRNRREPLTLQQRIREQINIHPREPGEIKAAWCRRLAEGAGGCSANYVWGILNIDEALAIGVAKREEEARAAMTVPALPFEGESLGPVFGKFKLVADSYRTHAMSLGDKYAEAYLEEMVSLCDRAQRRASQSKLG